MLFFLILPLFIFAQSRVEIAVIDSVGNARTDFILENTDSLHVNAKVKSILDSLNNNGFLSPVIEESGDSIVSIKINLGARYKWLNLNFKNKNKYIFDKLRFDILDWEGEFISPQKVALLSSEILDILDNSGYPFAYVKLDSIRFVGEDSISAKLVVDNNKKFFFDTIKVLSSLELSSKYLENFLEIKKGDVFSKAIINSISEKLVNLPFVKLKSPPTVSFYGNEASVNLNLVSKKVNRLDLLLGLLPTDSGTRKFKITGEATAELQNKLGRGERLYFKYKNLSEGKQNLRLDANYPYILNLPFGLDSKISIYINEDKYRDVKFDLGVQYLFSGVNYVKTYWNVFSSRLLSIDSTAMFDIGRLPVRLDVSVNSLGLQLNFNNLDYRFNPIHGLEVILDGNIGQRKILKNQQIVSLENESISFSDSYDSLKLNTYVFNISSSISYYIPIAKNMVFKLRNSTSLKKTEKKLYQNELYRLGGNKLLRGFDEESILGDFYSVSTAEFRMLIDKNSFLFIFTDYAFVRDPFGIDDKWDNPYGFGVGINFDTKGGIMSLSTAVGSRLNNPLDFKNVKIHIGYVSLF